MCRQGGICDGDDEFCTGGCQRFAEQALSDSERERPDRQGTVEIVGDVLNGLARHIDGPFAIGDA
jgi:hypothetical protein